MEQERFLEDDTSIHLFGFLIYLTYKKTFLFLFFCFFFLIVPIQKDIIFLSYKQTSKITLPTWKKKGFALPFFLHRKILTHPHTCQVVSKNILLFIQFYL